MASYLTPDILINIEKNNLYLHIKLLKTIMIIKNDLLKSIIEGIREKKGKNINTIEVKGISGAVCDYFVICEGNTPTQVSALAESVETIVKKNTNEKPVRIHGRQRSEWIVIDYGDIIVHIFLPELREYYKLDLLWDDARSEREPNID